MSIKSERERNGMTQLSVAQKMNVEQAAVCQWEKGKTKPRVDTLIKLADLFNCTVDELLKPQKNNAE